MCSCGSNKSLFSGLTVQLTTIGIVNYDEANRGYMNLKSKLVITEKQTETYKVGLLNSLEEELKLKLFLEKTANMTF